MEIFFNMIQTFKNQGFTEASMVAFKLLILDQAFVFVAKPHSYGLYKSYRKYHDGSLVPVTPQDNSSFLTHEDITGATTSDLFDVLSIMNQEYEVVKTLQSLKGITLTFLWSHPCYGRSLWTTRLMIFKFSVTRNEESKAISLEL